MYDDRTAEMLEPEPEVYGALVAAAAASESAVAQAVASFAPSPPAQSAASAAAPDAADDPDDAFAPVLDDVFATSASTWHEPTPDAVFGKSPQAMSEQNGDSESGDWHSGGGDTRRDEPHSQGPAIEPIELAGRGVGPTPPPDLFTDAPSLWSSAQTDIAPAADADEAPYQEPTFEQQPYQEPTFEQQPYQEPTFEQPSTGSIVADGDGLPVGVTAEQAWQAYEAFTAEQHVESPLEDVHSSAAVLEIEVPPGVASAPDGSTPQQLVLRIELAIVDSNGRRVDPSNLAVRVSPIPGGRATQPELGANEEASPEPTPIEPEPSQMAATALAIPTQSFDEPPWPTDVAVAFDSGMSEPSAWLDPPPPPPPPAQVNPPQHPVAAPAPFTTQTPWTQRPIDDPLTALSAPPPPTSYTATPQTQSSTFAPPSFAPPAFAPPTSPTPGNVTGSTVSTAGREASEPGRAPPAAEDGGEGGGAAAAAESSGSRRVALYTVGAGLVVVALALLFLQMMTNIL